MKAKKQKEVTRDSLDWEDEQILWELRVLSVLLETGEDVEEIIGLGSGIGGLLGLIEDRLEERFIDEHKDRRKLHADLVKIKELTKKEPPKLEVVQ